MKLGSTVKRFLCMVSCICLLSSSVYAATVTQKLDMFVGELKILDDVDVDRVAIGNGKLIKVQILPKSQLLIIAEQAGSTSLHLWHKDGQQSSFNLRIGKDDPEVRIRVESMIHMDVKIIEFRKQALTQLGIDWAKQIDGPGLAFAGDGVSSNLFRGTSTNPIFAGLPLNVKPFQAYFGIASEITSRINYLASSGDATTLAEPKLSCRNGGTARFLAGGEVPYPVTSALGQTNVEFKEYGIKLNISPVADPAGMIAAKILAEVSQLDPAVSVQGAPGLITRRTETEMNVRKGQTIVISGLLNGEISKDADKIPGLGDIPVIGWLFKSENYRNQLTELVVFVTPELYEANSPLNQKKIEQFKEKRQEKIETLEKKLKTGIME